jgi:hypothetical protein
MSWTQTAHRVTDNGEGEYNVYRDRDKMQCVTHYTVRRGGCLWTGSVSLLDQASGKSYGFHVNQAPWSDVKPAEAYWTRHQDKLT